MTVASAHVIYFSPTQTTRRVLEAIAQGLQAATVEHVDLTPPGAKRRENEEIHAELALIGVPVYGGRLPIDAVSRLRRLRGNATPAVVVVVYGNRAYEDALLELRDLALETGFKPFGAGAFVGEHSYSTDATPIAVGRPDAEDLRKAKEFGKRIQESLRNIRSRDEVVPIQVPGNFPYKEWRALSNISPVTDEDTCAKCGGCSGVCPVGAVTVGSAVTTDPGLCVRCCACVKSCPTGSRIMEDPRMRQVAEQLSAHCRERKEPEIYLGSSDQPD